MYKTKGIRWEVHGKVQTKGTVNSEVKKLFELWVFQKKKIYNNVEFELSLRGWMVVAGEDLTLHIRCAKNV